MNNLLMSAPTNVIRRYPKEMVPQEKMVRVYGYDPTRVSLQIRDEKSYAVTFLDADQITALIEALKDARDRIVA